MLLNIVMKNLLFAAWKNSSRPKIGQFELFSTMVFSSEKGFNIISYEFTDPNGKVFQQLTWEYELVSGVYLPIKTTEQNFRPDTGQLSYDKISTFKNLKINQPIPPELCL